MKLPPTEPTPQQTAGYHAHLAAHFRAQVYDKRTSHEARVLAEAQAIRSGISANDYQRRFATTVADRIYLPYVPGEILPGWSQWGQIGVFTHECRHVEQPATHGGLVALAAEGLNSTGQAQIEFEARLTMVELHWWRFGQLFDLDYLANGLREYGCTPVDVQYVRAALGQAAETVTRGGIITNPARVGIAWLSEHAPEIRALA